MRNLLVSVVLASIWIVAPARASTPVVGQSVIYHADSTHDYAAVVTGVWGAGEADLVVLASYLQGYSFGFGLSSRYDWPATYLADVIEGSGSNRWALNPGIGLGATGATGAAGATGSAGATGATGPGALVTSTTAGSLTIGGAAAQLDATHDVEYSATIKISATLTLTAGAAGHVDLICDSSSSPTTIRDTAQLELTGTLVVGANLVSSGTRQMRWRASPADYCRLASTNDLGTPTYTLLRQWVQVLGS